MGRYALIIGTDSYVDEKLSRLKTPVADVKAMADVLADQEFGAFDQVLQLINKEEREVRVTIAEFLEDKKPDDLILIYFSGHGVKDSNGYLYLALKDTISKPTRVSATALSSNFVIQQMDACRSRKQILILDCCYSGAFARTARTKGNEKAVTRATFEREGIGRIILTATDEIQLALEGEQVLEQTDFSLFTHYLLEGIKTGEADQNKDGVVSLTEWYDYAYSQVRMTTDRMSPQIWTYRRQQGDLHISKNPLFEILQREAAEKAAREEAERLRQEKEKREREILELERTIRERLEREAIDKARQEVEERARIEKEEKALKATELAAQEKEKREREVAELTAPQKAIRDMAERIEREQAEKAALEKLEREAAEKVERERSEQRAAQIAALKETFSRSFASLKSNLPKAIPFLRIVGFAGIAIGLILISSWGFPNLAALPLTGKPSATITPTSTLSITLKPSESPTIHVNFTKTLTPTPSEPFPYIVQVGDTLEGVATKFNLGQDGVLLIIDFNPDIMKNNGIFYVGQILTIPPPGTKLHTPTPIPFNLGRGAKIEYQILPGDTVESIAVKFNSKAQDIITLNRINPNELVIGQTIQVPVNLVTATATLPPSSTPILSGSRPTTYTLQPGEFPTCIARRFDVDPNELLALNSLNASSTIYPGIKLLIPQTGSFPGTRTLMIHPATYTVSSSGETVYSIACAFGDLDPIAIAQANGIPVAASLSVDQKLFIP